MLASFVVAFVVATFGATLVLDASLAVRFPYLASLRDAYLKQSEPVVLSLGSSRTAHNFDVNLVSPMLGSRGLAAFNGSVFGSALTTQEEVLEELLEAGPPPALVTVEVSPEFLHRKLPWIHMSRDVTWSNFVEITGDLGGRRGSRLLETRVLPVYARRHGVRRAVCRAVNSWFGRSNEAFEEGIQTGPPVWDGRLAAIPPMPDMTEELRITQRRYAPKPIEKFSATGSAARSLERMLDSCRRLGVPVLLIDPPICSASREVLQPVDADYRKYIATVLERFPNARYFDGKDALPDQAFLDQHHVNAYGRHVMSQTLAGKTIPETLDSWRRIVASKDERRDVARKDESRATQ
jgi:hypothetical protein